MTKHQVEFGETKSDVHVLATGIIRHFVKLSPSFALCALDLDEDMDYGQYFLLDEIHGIRERQAFWT